MTMLAVLQKPNDTSANSLYVGETEKPKFDANTNQILVRVKASALNRADVSQRMGKYPPPPGESTIIGLEMYVIVVKRIISIMISRIRNTLNLLRIV